MPGSGHSRACDLSAHPPCLACAGSFRWMLSENITERSASTESKIPIVRGPSLRTINYASTSDLVKALARSLLAALARPFPCPGHCAVAKSF